jgi:hypothetical protein
MNLDTIVKTEYTSIYNMRPGEMCGMGKESLIVSHPGQPLGQFLKNLQANSSLKFENDIEFIADEWFHNEEWTKYIGQPMFFITDIKIEEVK